ncbi:hypothetical protein BGZ73_003936 [Actinomortierella ambigua]|nr:hypothetical protein BGZ73_003936 [Actinomortierella ambigua]
MSNPPPAPGSSLSPIPSSTPSATVPSQPAFGIPDPAMGIQASHPNQYRVGGYVGSFDFDNVVLLPEQHGQHQGEASGSSANPFVGAGGAQDPATTPAPAVVEGSEQDTGINKFMRLIREGKAAAHEPPGKVFTLPVERPGKNLQ